MCFDLPRNMTRSTQRKGIDIESIVLLRYLRIFLRCRIQNECLGPEKNDFSMSCHQYHCYFTKTTVYNRTDRHLVQIMFLYTISRCLSVNPSLTEMHTWTCGGCRDFFNRSGTRDVRQMSARLLESDKE